MKKSCSLFVFLLAFVTLSFGTDVSVGVKVGVNHSSYTGEDYKYFLRSYPELSNAFNLGFQAGAFVTIGIFNYVVIEPEVVIVRSGDMFKEDVKPTFEGFVKYYDHLLYLESTVLIKLRSGTSNIFAGPTIMLRLSDGTYGYKADDSAIVSDESDYASDDFNRAVFAVTAGIGFLRPIGLGSIVVEIRGRYCFQNLLNEDIYAGVLKQIAAMTMIGYSFPIRN